MYVHTHTHTNNESLYSEKITSRASTDKPRIFIINQGKQYGKLFTL